MIGGGFKQPFGIPLVERWNMECLLGIPEQSGQRSQTDGIARGSEKSHAGRMVDSLQETVGREAGARDAIHHHLHRRAFERVPEEPFEVHAGLRFQPGFRIGPRLGAPAEFRVVRAHQNACHGGQQAVQGRRPGKIEHLSMAGERLLNDPRLAASLRPQQQQRIATAKRQPQAFDLLRHTHQRQLRFHSGSPAI